VNAPAPKETLLHRRLRQLGEYAKRLETEADRKLSEAHGTYDRVVRNDHIEMCAGYRPAPPLKRAAAVCLAGIYRRRAKLARRDEKRFAAVVAYSDEQERRAEGRREKSGGV
jgi:hypothetical protein